MLVVGPTITLSGRRRAARATVRWSAMLASARGPTGTSPEARDEENADDDEQHTNRNIKRGGYPGVGIEHLHGGRILHPLPNEDAIVATEPLPKEYGDDAQCYRRGTDRARHTTAS